MNVHLIFSTVYFLWIANTLVLNLPKYTISCIVNVFRTHSASLRRVPYPLFLVTYTSVNDSVTWYSEKTELPLRSVVRGHCEQFLLTYLLTPRCRVLLEKLTGLQLVKKFPVFLWSPKFHYRTHKPPPPVPILGQPNPVHVPTTHLLETHPNTIQPSTPRYPQWSLSLQFPHQEPIRPPLLTHTDYNDK